MSRPRPAMSPLPFWQAAPPSPEESAAAAGGIWGMITATLDWCEENYVVTPLIAEWWNTLSNLLMIGLALFGLGWAGSNKLETRFVLSFLALLVVGIGSAAFHCTLRFGPQMLDEVPMIWANSAFIFAIASEKTRLKRLPLLVTGVVLYSLIVTCVYAANKNVLFHETSYALGVAFIIYRCLNIIKQHPKTIELQQLLKYGLTYYLGAFVLWNIDNLFCPQLRALRGSVGLLIGPLFQLHAWWHIGTGLGTYYYITFSAFQRELERRESPTIRWKFGMIPYMQTRRQTEYKQPRT